MEADDWRLELRKSEDWMVKLIKAGNWRLGTGGPWLGTEGKGLEVVDWRWNVEQLYSSSYRTGSLINLQSGGPRDL